MGYRVQAYSLAELRRISAPGAVVPSLFWLLPVGRCQPIEIDHLWQQFTDSNSGYCYDLGLALVRNLVQPRGRDPGPVDLSSLSATLEYLVPEGAREYLPHPHGTAGHQVLFLSGAYPQPGWGLLVDAPEHDLRRFVDAIVHEAVGSLLRLPGGQEAMAAIAAATKAFHQLQTVLEDPPQVRQAKPIDSQRTGELRKYGGSLVALRSALSKGDMAALNAARQGIVVPNGFAKILVLDEKLIVQLTLVVCPRNI